MPSYGRIRDDTTSRNAENCSWYLNGSLYADYGNYYIDDNQRLCMDTLTPNYSKRIASGEIINHDCYMCRMDENTSGGYYHATYGSTVYDGVGAIMARLLSTWPTWKDVTPMAIDTQYLIDHAVQQCVGHIDDTPYAFGEDLAEIGETLRYLRNPGKSVLNLTRKMLDRKWKATKRLKKASEIAEVTNDLYLNYRFALMPMVRSAADATLALEGGLRRYLPPRLTARGFASDSKTFTDTVQLSIGSGKYNEFQRTGTNEVQVRAYVIYSNTAMNAGNWNHTLGLRGKDAPETLWNIVPLSFMVDRVFDISSAIRGVANLSDPSIRILASGYVVKTQRSWAVRYTKQHNPPFTVSVAGDASHNVEYYQRNTEWRPSYRDVLPVPRWGNLVRDAQSVADLFALGASQLKRFGFVGEAWASRGTYTE